MAELVAYFVLLALSFFLCLWRSLPHRKPNRPPGPFRLPIVGNLPKLFSLSHRSLSALSRRHGPFMSLQFGRSLIVVASSAAAARVVWKTHDLVFASRPCLTVTEHLFHGLKDVVFAPYGEHWRQAKKVCVLHLLSPKRVQSYRSEREEEVHYILEKIRRQSLSGPVDLSAMVRAFTNGVVGRVALGKRSDDRWQLLDEVGSLLGEVFVEDFFPRLAWVSKLMGKHGRLRRCFSELQSFLDEVIEDHAERHGQGGEDVADGDLVDVLLALQKDDDRGIFQARDCIKAISLSPQPSP